MSPVSNLLQSSLTRELGESFAEYRFCLAVSGGKDSMVLLHLMASLLPPHRLVVAHFNHATRGPESDADAALVESAAAARGVELCLGRKEGGGTDEATLRKSRLAFLERTRKRTSSDFVVTAHNANDLAETFFMRVIRGSGIDGLSAILPRNGKKLRPLLGASRGEIDAFARANGVAFREDASNRDPRYFRNRVRLGLMAHIEELSEAHGGMEKFLGRFLETAAELRWARGYLASRARGHYRRLVVETPFWFRLSRESLLSLDEGWAERVLRRLCRRLEAEVPSRRRLLALMADIHRGARASSAIGGVAMRASCGHLFFSSPAQRRRLESFTLRDLGLELQIHSHEAELRFFQPGDRYRGRKLKEIFLERRIPEPERRLLPVLVKRCEESVAWVFPDESREVTVDSVTFPFSFLSSRA